MRYLFLKGIFTILLLISSSLVPVALDSAVSTDGNMERFPTLSRDGKNLFFVRAIGDHYPGDDARFYWISAEILEGLKK